MGLSVAQRQQLVVDELSTGADDVHYLADRVAIYWVQFADRDVISPYLTDQYVKRKLAQALIGPLRLKYDGSTADESLHEHQVLDTLETIVATASAEIVRLETKAARSRTGTASTMARPTPAPYPVLPLRDDRAVMPEPGPDQVLPRNRHLTGG